MSKIDSNTQDKFIDKYKDILRKIQYVISHIDQKGILSKTDCLKKIVKSLVCLVNFKYFIRKQMLSSEHKHLNSFIQLIHKTINICLLLKFKLKDEIKMGQISHEYHILMQKLLIFMIISTINEDSWNYSQKKNQIYYQSLMEIVSSEESIIVRNLLSMYSQFIMEIEKDKIYEINAKR